MSEERKKRLHEAYQYLRSRGIVHTQDDVAAIMKAHKTGVSRAFNGFKDYLTDNFIKRFCKAFSDINVDWLLAGEGQMLKNDDYYPLQREEGLPLIPFEFMAGYGEDSPGITLNDCERYVIPEFEDIGAEFLIRVRGSSMYPKYSNGDILACKKVRDILFFQWGKVYAIDSHSQGQLVKRVFEHEDPERILLVSDNKEKYPPFPIPKLDIRSLSIVLGAIRRE